MWREKIVVSLIHFVVRKRFNQAMIGQAKISTFFTTNSSKRSVTESKNEQISSKKIKTDTSSSDDGAKLVSADLSLLVNVGPSWKKALKPEFEKPYFLQLSKFVQGERAKYTVYPPANQVFSWTKTCDIQDVKVVILGQDPYHGPRQAHGLCFSVQQGVPPPPSLVNMYKELESDIDGFQHPGHGTLVGWARQGVLLLNACLTVRGGNANSHAGKGWEKLTDAVIVWLNSNLDGVVFMLWGAYAQKKGERINKKRHHILKSVHPSPLSAHRGFLGCKHFSQCNKLLKDQHKKPIDWKCLPRE